MLLDHAKHCELGMKKWYECFFGGFYHTLILASLGKQYNFNQFTILCDIRICVQDESANT